MATQTQFRIRFYWKNDRQSVGDAMTVPFLEAKRQLFIELHKRYKAPDFIAVELETVQHGRLNEPLRLTPRDVSKAVASVIDARRFGKQKAINEIADYMGRSGRTVRIVNAGRKSGMSQIQERF